eukprot:7122447-Ditylum_brightwellii.AAC.1
MVECTENMCIASVAPGRPRHAGACANTGNCVMYKLFGNGTTAMSIVSCGGGELLALDNGVGTKDSTTMVGTERHPLVLRLCCGVLVGNGAVERMYKYNMLSPMKRATKGMVLESAI